MAKVQKNVVVQDWFIQIYPGNAIVILGIRPEDGKVKFWRSSPIVKRITNKVVESHTGSRYTLRGNLNMANVKEMTDHKAYRLDQELMDKFLRGFPVKWKTHLTRFCGKMKQEKQAEDTDSGELSGQSVEGGSTHASVPLRGQGQASKGKVKPRSTEGDKESEIKEKAVQKKGDWDESRYFDDLPDMKYSSRGRLIKTPNANISYECDMDGNFIGLSPQLFTSKVCLTPVVNIAKMKKTKRGQKPKASHGDLHQRGAAGKKKTESSQTPIARGKVGRNTATVVQNVIVHQGEEGKKGNLESRTPIRRRNLRRREPKVLLQSVPVKPATQSSDHQAPKKESKKERKSRTAAPRFTGKKSAKVIGESSQGETRKKTRVPKVQLQNSPEEGAKETDEDFVNETPLGSDKKRGREPKAALQNLPGKQDPGKKAEKKGIPPEGTKNPVAKKLTLEDQPNILLQNLRGKQAVKEQTTSSSSEPNLVLAKRGTLKRTRQIQEAIRGLDAGYSDDPFADATPLKKKAKIQFLNLDDGDSDSSEVGEELGVNDCNDEESPATTWRQRLGAPLSKTPDLTVYDFDEPMVIRSDERKAAAQISYRIRKKRPLNFNKDSKGRVQKQQKKGKHGKLQASKALAVASRKLENLVESDGDSDGSDSYYVEMMSNDNSSCEEDIFDTL